MALKWIKNYLTDRSHFVQIGAKTSDTTTVSRGVPQGSVLGPILYSVYTNELPEVIVDKDCMEDVHDNPEKLFSENCTQCGCLPVFVDDATYIISKKTMFENQQKVTENVEKIKIFLNDNDLTVNVAKTTMLELMVKQKHMRAKGTQPKIVTTDEKGDEKVVKPAGSIRILGGNFQENLGWTAHLKTVIACTKETFGCT